MQLDQLISCIPKKWKQILRRTEIKFSTTSISEIYLIDNKSYNIETLKAKNFLRNVIIQNELYPSDRCIIKWFKLLSNLQ